MAAVDGSRNLTFGYRSGLLATAIRCRGGEVNVGVRQHRLIKPPKILHGILQ